MRREELWREDIRRVANLATRRNENIQSVCIAGMTESSLQKEVSAIFAQAMAEKNKKVLLVNAGEERNAVSEDEKTFDRIERDFNQETAEWLQETKKSYDCIILNALPINQHATGTEVAALCETTVLLIEKGKMNGNRAMWLKREMDMNGIHILGAIFVK